MTVQGYPWSSMDFGTNWKPSMRLSISIQSSNLCPILHRFGDTFDTTSLKGQSCDQFLYFSLSFGALLRMLHLEVRLETCHKETTVIGLSCCENHTIVAWVIFIQCRRLTEGRTKRRVAKLCIIQAPKFFAPKIPLPPNCGFPRARYADALWKYIFTF